MVQVHLGPQVTDLLVLPTVELSDAELHAIRSLMDHAFEGNFTDDDWEHSVGGTHVFLREEDVIMSHAAVVERQLVAGETPLRTGYVEGVATHPAHRRQGYATAVMSMVNEIISANFELGALSTDVPELYLKLGWERWRGPTYVATSEGLLRTENEDAGIMVLRTEPTSKFTLSESLACDARRGDAW